MGKKKKFNLVKFVLTALTSGGVAFGIGFLLSFMRAPLGDWFNIAQAGFGLALFGVGMKMRKGKESFVESVPTVGMISIFYGLLEKLPFSIPYLKFAVEWSFEGLVLILGTVWLAESLIQRVMK